MPRQTAETDSWQAGVLNSAPVFREIQAYLRPFLAMPAWPDLEQYQNYLDTSPATVKSGGGKKLCVLPQGAKAKSFHERYLVRVYSTGEIQTRVENWHDFFQVITWRMFPKAKAVLNKRHYYAAKTHYLRQHEGLATLGARSAEENLLSLFDEGGVVILSDRPDLLQCLREFQWRDLFLHQRQLLNQHFHCIVFGHALYEKLVKPYVGMTGNAVLIQTSTGLLSTDMESRINYADSELAQVLDNKDNASPLQGPKDLHPFPLLGMPGLWPGNDTPEFYNNTHYFRSKRTPGTG